LTLVTLIPAITDNLGRTNRREVVDAALQPARQQRSLVFMPSLAGPFLQHPLSFLRNQPGLTGQTVYALDGANRNFDVMQELPGRQAFVLSMPGGFDPDPAAAPVEAILDRLHTVRGTTLSVDVVAVPGLEARDPELRVNLGAFALSTPFVADGAGRGVAHFTITRTASGLRVDSPNEAGVSIRPKRTNALVISVWAPDLLGGTAISSRLVPLRESAGSVAVLWPGTLWFDKNDSHSLTRSTVSTRAS
jgi:hypothetical protein